MKKYIGITAVLCLTAAAMSLYVLLSTKTVSPTQHNATVLEIDFLDIGQGDATLITFLDKRQMLIDCAIDARILEALGRVMEFHDTYIDYLVVTHPDADHYGGCIDVIERFEIGSIVLNGLEKEDLYYKEFARVVAQEDAEIIVLESEELWSIAGTTLHWLYPDHNISIDSSIPNFGKDTGPNDTSIVVKMTYGDVDILLTGDAEEAEELYLVNKYNQALDVEILKAGHHGSNTSSILPFVEATSPDYVIFSAGEENNFGHPSLRVIRRFERQGAEIFRTDIQGDISVDIKENGFIFFHSQ